MLFTNNNSRLAWVLIGLLGAMAVTPTTAWALGEVIVASPTTTLADLSTIPGIQRTVSFASSGGSADPIYMQSDRQYLLAANISASPSAAAEADTYFDNPNTPKVESISLASISSNGVLTVGMRSLFASSSGYVTLYADDISGGYSFVFLEGVDDTLRFWNVPLAYFNTFDSAHVRDIAFVLFGSSMPNNSTPLLSVHFRGHPYIPALNRSEVVPASLTALTGVSIGSVTAYPPIAQGSNESGGTVTYLHRISATNFAVDLDLPSPDSKASVQIDRGSLNVPELLIPDLDGSGVPQLNFDALPGDLYAAESSTNLMLDWQTVVSNIWSSGVVSVANFTPDASAGYARVITKQLPVQNLDTFSFGAQVNGYVLLELVDTSGITAPFYIFGTNAMNGYSLTAVPLPENFDKSSVSTIRFEFMNQFNLYPNANIVANAEPFAAEIRILNIGPLAPPR